MTTLAELIDDTERELYGIQLPLLNRLRDSMDASVTTAPLEFDVRNMQVPGMLACEQELFASLAIDRTNKDVTVIRGFSGTDPAAHDSGALVEINPRFPRYSILRALQQEVRSWGEKLYTVGTTSGNVQAGSYTVSLPTLDRPHRVLEVWLPPDTGDDRWRKAPHVENVDLPVENFPSKRAIVLKNCPPKAAAAHVVYAQQFKTDTWTETTNLEDIVGLYPALFDIPVWGALWRLLSAKEVKRTFSEGLKESARDEAHPPNHAAQTAEGFRILRNRRLAEEHANLLGQHGVKI